MSATAAHDHAILRRQLRRAEAAARRLRAPVSLIDFAQVLSPDPADMDGLDTLYDASPAHKLIAEKLHDLFEGRISKLAIALPPRAGKSELAVRNFIPWWIGRRPADHIAFATYNDEFSGDMGRDVRTNMQSAAYRDIFPGAQLDANAQSADRLGTVQKGRIVFVGRGGALTGRGFDLGVIDDLIKDHIEAESPALRRDAWRWFTRVFLTRKMTDQSRILLIGTRWNEDDIQGRLSDPRNPCYDAEEAKTWTFLRVPAISEGEEVDPLKRPIGTALWPKRFSIGSLESMRRLDAQGFSALYQGKPTPEEGSHFTKQIIRTYNRDDLPDASRLRFYASSDHGVSTKQRADPTCLIPAAVDDQDNLYILPDVAWKRMAADVQINAMIQIIKNRKPLFWWAERGHISLAIGPALRAAMLANKAYATIDDFVPAADKRTRSQAIHARMAMGKVFFPSFAPWWGDALNELLTFPGGAHDDFVDALSLLGLKLQMQHGRSAPKATETPAGDMTMRWVRESAAVRKANATRARVRANWG